MAFLRCREHKPVQRRIVADHRVSVHRNIKAAGLNEVMIVVITFACRPWGRGGLHYAVCLHEIGKGGRGLAAAWLAQMGAVPAMNAKWNGLSMVRQIRPTSSEFWHGWSDLMLTKQRSPTPTGSSALHGASCPGALGSGGGGGGWGSKMPPPLPCKDLAREGDGGGAPPSINHPAGQERPSDGGCMNAGSDDDEALGIWSARNRPCMGGGCQAPARPAANIRGQAECLGPLLLWWLSLAFRFRHLVPD